MAINKHILLAVSGGIAAYKSAELVRLLRKNGAEVRVVMTQAATQFVSTLTFQALSGHAVHTDLLNAEAEHAMDHISLARWADALLIAPASANTIAKCSQGLADDLLSTLYLAATCPVYVAPAMNQAMWHHPATQENIAKLKNHGVIVIGPEPGEQACGETGLGRMSEPAAICEQILAPTSPQHLRGVNVLISAGPTREPLDPVRYLTNRSSGKMGYALASAALQAGANVTLISGPVSLTAPVGVDLIKVDSAAQMYQEIISRAEAHAIYIGAAAVADYTPTQVQLEKIKKHDLETSILLTKTEDILAAVAKLPQRPFTVGFAAETENLAANAVGKLTNKNLDMIAANWVGHNAQHGGFDSEVNALQLFWKNGQKNLALADKRLLATQLIDVIAERFNEKNTA